MGGFSRVHYGLGSPTATCGHIAFSGRSDPGFRGGAGWDGGACLHLGDFEDDGEGLFDAGRGVRILRMSSLVVGGGARARDCSTRAMALRMSSLVVGGRARASDFSTRVMAARLSSPVAVAGGAKRGGTNTL